MNNDFNNSKLEFREIVLGHIKRILELSTHELKDGSHSVSHANYTQVVIEEDTRMSYVQAIENLCYVLLPHFDKKMTEEYEKCIDVITGFGYEVRDILKEHYEKFNSQNKCFAYLSFISVT